MVFILSSCIARQRVRTECDTNEIWVCQELEDTYFYWDEADDKFYGTLTYGGETYEFFLSGSSGLVLTFVEPEALNKEGIDIEKYRIFSGVADYQKGIIPLKIKNDQQNVFKGEIADITFVCCDREEYFKSLNLENAE